MRAERPLDLVARDRLALDLGQRPLVRRGDPGRAREAQRHREQDGAAESAVTLVPAARRRAPSRLARELGEMPLCYGSAARCQGLQGLSIDRLHRGVLVVACAGRAAVARAPRARERRTDMSRTARSSPAPPRT